MGWGQKVLGPLNLCLQLYLFPLDRTTTIIKKKIVSRTLSERYKKALKHFLKKLFRCTLRAFPTFYDYFVYLIIKFLFNTKFHRQKSHTHASLWIPQISRDHLGTNLQENIFNHALTILNKNTFKSSIHFDYNVTHALQHNKSYS